MNGVIALVRVRTFTHVRPVNTELGVDGDDLDPFRINHFEPLSLAVQSGE